MIQQRTQNFLNLLAWRDFETGSTTSCTLWYTGNFSPREKIVSYKRMSHFFCVLFLYHYLDTRAVSGKTGMPENATLLLSLYTHFWSWKLRGIARCVLDGPQKFSPRTVTVYGSSVSETPTHRVLLIVLETHHKPGQARGTRNTDAVYFPGRPFPLLRSRLPCRLASASCRTSLRTPGATSRQLRQRAPRLLPRAVRQRGSAPFQRGNG